MTVASSRVTRANPSRANPTILLTDWIVVSVPPPPAAIATGASLDPHISTKRSVLVLVTARVFILDSSPDTQYL
jgi:hypothetical protein